MHEKTEFVQSSKEFTRICVSVGDTNPRRVDDDVLVVDVDLQGGRLRHAHVDNLLKPEAPPRGDHDVHSDSRRVQKNCDS